jgi:ferric-dicitrate binding protein FerR (iron transport regulator)
MQQKQTDKSFRMAELAGKYLRGTITAAELAELKDWANATKGGNQLMQEVTDAEWLQREIETFSQTNTEESWLRLQGKVLAAQAAKGKKPASIRPFWVKIAAAVLVLAVAGWLIISESTRKKEIKSVLASRYGNDIQPGTKKAELTLSNGTSLDLQQGSDSSFTEQGSWIQRTADGRLLYQKYGAAGLTSNGLPGHGIIGWNTIRIPNGGEYVVTLDDGTKVWLNAASSLHYPVRFTGKERRVELTGEAYFEVAKDKTHPFIVVTSRMQVQAVGTAFNVNSYRNADSTTITTLAEGKIKVTTQHKTVLVNPGQQVKTNLTTAAVSEGDVETATAWKNGLFIFNATPLQEVLIQLSRWYDVSIVYDRHFNPSKYFTGEIKRNVPVSKLLQMMEMTGIARFRITNNTVTVLPYNN